MMFNRTVFLNGGDNRSAWDQFYTRCLASGARGEAGLATQVPCAIQTGHFLGSAGGHFLGSAGGCCCCCRIPPAVESWEPCLLMEGEAKTSVASASDAGGQSEAGARRAEAGASIAGCRSLSALRAEEAVVSWADFLRWSGQVESEVQRVASRVNVISGSLSSRVEEIAGSLSAIKDAVATCSSQCSHLESALQQLVDNHAARSDALRDVRDVLERLMQKSQLSVDAALWNKTSSRRHWLIRGCIPPNLGESPADVHAFVGESVNVTSHMVDQFRPLSGFEAA